MFCPPTPHPPQCTRLRVKPICFKLCKTSTVTQTKACRGHLQMIPCLLYLVFMCSPPFTMSAVSGISDSARPSAPKNASLCPKCRYDEPKSLSYHFTRAKNPSAIRLCFSKPWKLKRYNYFTHISELVTFSASNQSYNYSVINRTTVKYFV